MSSYQTGEAVGGEAEGEEGSVGLHVDLAASPDCFQAFDGDVLLVAQS